MKERPPVDLPAPLVADTLDVLLGQLTGVVVSGPDADGHTWIHGRRRRPPTLLSALNLSLEAPGLVVAALEWRASAGAER